MKKYSKLPKVVEACQWFPNKEVEGVFVDSDGVYVITIHLQKSYLAPGDYVVREPDGLHHYPVKKDIFEKDHREL